MGLYSYHREPTSGAGVIFTHIEADALDVTIQELKDKISKEFEEAGRINRLASLG